MEQYNLAGDGYLLLHLEQVGGSGGVEALWMRAADPATVADAAQAGLTPRWHQLTNVNGTARWELRCVAED